MQTPQPTAGNANSTVRRPTPAPLLKHSINLIPARRDLYQAKLVFYLFLASLGMFFLASLLTYVIVRDQAFNPIPDAVPNSIATLGPEVYAPLKLPMSFWISTVALIFVSVALHRACWMIRREQQVGFRRWLVAAWIAAIAFTVIQGFGMTHLLSEHFSTYDGSMKVYGMSFTLSFIHALHVIGGMVFLGFVIRQASRNRYDHERHWAVENCASYWHFLDVVWVCMLITFVVAK
jgi:heme/copper-type cytochrome/quinol oxidase subunit 3